jgi:hypothetical protein
VIGFHQCLIAQYLGTNLLSPSRERIKVRGFTLIQLLPSREKRDNLASGAI